MGIMAAFTLTFLFAAGDWVTPKLVGGPYTSMIGTFIQYQYGSRFNQPLGSALAFTVIAISLLILVTIALVGKRILKPR
jgi:spermidine/putrescine transport system permease protein